MRLEPRCLVCSNAATRVAADELRHKGLSLRDIQQKIGRSRSSLSRHFRHAEKASIALERPQKRHESRAGRQRDASRCGACGISFTESDAESLLRRAERILWIAETIAAQAQRDDDARLALQAVDRARSSLETMMRATGMFSVDRAAADRRTLNIFANVPVDEVRRILDALPPVPLTEAVAPAPVSP